jgi:hypothetical protein
MPSSPIKGLYGEDINVGDRVVVSWTGLGRARSPRRARGVVTSIGTGGVMVRFDQALSHNSQRTGVTYRHDHWVCMHSHGGHQVNRYTLDGYPCRDGILYIAKEELFDLRGEPTCVS